MPLIEVTLVTGRPPERLRALIHELHEAAVRTLGAPPGSVRVVLREVPPTHWAAGDQTIAERSAAENKRAAENKEAAENREAAENKRAAATRSAAQSASAAESRLDLAKE